MPTKLKKGNIVLAKTTSKAFLSNIIEPYASRLASSWSRVRVVSEVPGQTAENRFDMRIYYLDLGLHDIVTVNVDPAYHDSPHQFVDYQFADMPLQFKMCPVFNYVIRLNRVRKSFLSFLLSFLF